MVYRIFAGIFIVLGIIGIIRTLTDKEGKTFNLVGLRKEQYMVINREKFNNIMRNSNIAMFIWVLLMGILCIYTKEEIFLALGAFNVLINMIFSKKAKKYIEIK